jgi:hopanoid biosynthesis associated RND transporter like protein HpnN
MTAEQVRPEEATVVHRLLIGLVTCVCRFPWFVLAFALGLGAVSVYLFCTRLEYRTQRSDLANPNKDYQQRWRRYLEEFGHDDDIVVVVEGGDRSRMRQALEALAVEVRRHPQHFDRLFYKVDLRNLHDRALLYLPADQIQHIQDNLRSMSLLLEVGPVGWQALTLFRLLHEARDRAGKISPGKGLTAADDQFLAQLLGISRSATAALADPDRYRNPWRSLLTQAPEQKDLLAEPQYFFSGDGSLAFLLARPVKEEASFTATQGSVAILRDLLAAVRPEFPDLDFGLTGLPVLETDEMVASQTDTHTASWLSLGGVALLFFLCFRGVRCPLLTVGTLLIGTAWAMGWLTLTVGHLNILSATFAMMLLGLGDYGVLWVTRYEQERAAGADVVTAVQRTAGRVGPGILTAALTTALAFYAAMLADFQAVAELGWIAGSGVLLCACSCLTVMPALLKIADRRATIVRIEDGRWGIEERSAFEGRSRNGWRVVTARTSLLPPRSSGQPAWLPGLARRPRWVLGISLALTLVLGTYAGRIQYDHNLLHLQADGLESVRWELKLIERTAGASWHALSYTASQAEALALKDRFAQLPEVSRVVEVASLVPQQQERKIEQLRDVQHRLRRLPERGRSIPHALPNPVDVRAELTCLIGQLQPLADASPQPLLADLRRSLLGLWECLADLPAPTAARRLQEFEQRLAGDLAEDLHRLREVSRPAPITLADLPADLRARYVGQNGQWLLRVFAKDCLWDYAPLAHFVAQIQTVDPEATGKPFSTLEGLRAMQNGFLRAGLYALAAIVLVLLADFRSWRHTLMALAPLGMGLVLALGVMGLCGWPLNPANMIVFPLIVGVGVDNGVHVLHDYLARRGERPRYTLSHATGRGILVAALTTMLGFGALMISRHQGLSSLGFLLTLGVGCCTLTALVFLPAVLRVLSKPERRAVPASEPTAQKYQQAAA